MQEEDEQVAGNESDGPEDREGESVPEQVSSQRIVVKRRGRKRPWLSIVAALCLLIGMGYLYLRGVKSDILPHRGAGAPQIEKMPIPKEQLLIFPSFVIPVKENRRFTYISLSIYFNVPNKEIRGEMLERKGELRGIIYDILREEINKTKEVPSLETLKVTIIRGLNSALSAGKVDEVYIAKFLAV